MYVLHADSVQILQPYLAHQIQLLNNMDEDAPDIPKLARACQESIAELREHDLSRFSHGDGPYRRLDDWVAVWPAMHLRLWIEYLGVYGEGDSSVVHRLSGDQNLTNRIVRLLLQIDDRLQYLLSAVIGKVPLAPEQFDSRVFARHDDQKPGTNDYEDIIENQRTKIQDRLQHLTLIARSIRRKEVAELAACVAAHEQRGLNGRVLQDKIKDFITSILNRASETIEQPAGTDMISGADLSEHVKFDSETKQCRISDGYSQDLLESMIFERWLRVSYQGDHATDPAISIAPFITSTASTDATPQPDHANVVLEPAAAEMLAANHKADQDISPSETIETAATKLPADRAGPEESAAISQAPGAVASSKQASVLGFPPPPHPLHLKRSDSWCRTMLPQNVAKTVECVEECQGIFEAVMGQCKNGKKIYDRLAQQSARLNWLAVKMGLHAVPEWSIQHKLSQAPRFARFSLRDARALKARLASLKSKIPEKDAQSAADSRHGEEAAGSDTMSGSESGSDDDDDRKLTFRSC
jgi:hypothetical protein